MYQDIVVILYPCTKQTADAYKSTTTYLLLLDKNAAVIAECDQTPPSPLENSNL